MGRCGWLLVGVVQLALNSVHKVIRLVTIGPNGDFRRLRRGAGAHGDAGGYQQGEEKCAGFQGELFHWIILSCLVGFVGSCPPCRSSVPASWPVPLSVVAYQVGGQQPTKAGMLWCLV